MHADTARSFCLETLTRFADRELRIADLHALAAGRFARHSLEEALRRLKTAGLVVAVVEPDRSVWWAIAMSDRDAPEQGEPSRPAPQSKSRQKARRVPAPSPAHRPAPAQLAVPEPPSGTRGTSGRTSAARPGRLRTRGTGGDSRVRFGACWRRYAGCRPCAAGESLEALDRRVVCARQPSRSDRAVHAAGVARAAQEPQGAAAKPAHPHVRRSLERPGRSHATGSRGACRCERLLGRDRRRRCRPGWRRPRLGTHPDRRRRGRVGGPASFARSASVRSDLSIRTPRPVHGVRVVSRWSGGWSAGGWAGGSGPAHARVVCCAPVSCGSPRPLPTPQILRQIGRPHPDAVGDTDGGDLAPIDDLVHRGRRHLQPRRHLPHVQ